MTNYTQIQISLSPSLPYVPNDINTNTIYTIIKKEDLLYIKSGEIEIPTNEFVLQTFFIPQNDVSWDDIDFEN